MVMQHHDEEHMGNEMRSLDAGALGRCAEAQLHDHTRHAAEEYLAGDPGDPLSQGTQSADHFPL